MIKSIINWIKDSNRYTHLGLGIIFGIIAKDWYCLEYGAIGTAGALELKDKLWGAKWDWIDFVLTVVGFNIGYLIRMLFLKYV